MNPSRLVFCTFPQGLIREPLLYNLGKDYEVVPNIRGATITDDIGRVYLEIEGAAAESEKAVAYLRSRGVEVQDVDVIPADGAPPQEV